MAPPCPLPQNGDTFVLNGKPFVGTGFGYDPAAVPGPRGCPPKSIPKLEALMPNRTGRQSRRLCSTVLAGGANESYDAADYQNMILAAVAYDPLDSYDTRPAFVSSAGTDHVLGHSQDTSMTDTNRLEHAWRNPPSLHR